MFQLGPKWFLAEAEHVFKNDIHNIRLRGCAQNELEIPVPAEFSHLSKFPSVDDIAFQFCPTRRDFYLKRVRREQGKKTWGRIAGPLVESYCKGLMDKFHDQKWRSNNYKKISGSIDEYSAEHEKNHQTQFISLGSYVSMPTESVEKFRHYLGYTGKFELSMLEADRRLGKRIGKAKRHEFLQNFPVQYQDITLKPNPKLIGISSPSKPDFLIPTLSIVGDVKSGRQFEDYYRLTCAGYALAYENEYGENHNINFGIIYFLGTHTANFYTAQTYLFLIDDELRREFLDKRNETLKILASNPAKAPDFVDREKYCVRCKYLEVCDADRSQEKNQSPST